MIAVDTIAFEPVSFESVEAASIADNSSREAEK